MILKAAAGEPIPLYGDGQNVDVWLYVEDHVDALLLANPSEPEPEIDLAFILQIASELRSLLLDRLGTCR